MALMSLDIRLAWPALLLLGGAAMAQPAPAPQPNPQERREPIPETPAQPLVPPGPSDRGVIRPPSGFDPGIHAPVPEPMPNTTPVIPPPGTPGSDSLTTRPR